LPAEKLLCHALALEQRLFDYQLDFSYSFVDHVPGLLLADSIERKHSDLFDAQLLRLFDYYALPKWHLSTLEI
jgi:hypothetical protein